MSDLEDKVLNEIGKIIDLENGLALSEMKMIRLVREIERSVVKIDFTPTSPFCPMAIRLAVEIKNKAENVDGVKNVRGHIMGGFLNSFFFRSRCLQWVVLVDALGSLRVFG